jgi:hypothetical protein
MLAEASGTRRGIEYSIDGVPQPSFTNGVGAVAADEVNLGPGGGRFYDDIAIATGANDYPIGDREILPITVTSSFAYNPLTPLATDFANNDGSAANATTAGRLDEIPLGSGGDWVSQANNTATNYLSFRLRDPLVNRNPRAMRGLLAYHSAVGANAWGTTRFTDYFDSGSCINAPACALWNMNAGATLTYSGSMINAPFTGWNPLNMDYRIVWLGFSNNTAQDPYWDGVMAEVEYPTIENRPVAQSKPTVLSLSGDLPPPGSLVTATSTGTWSGGPYNYTYEWYTCDEESRGCSLVGGQTTSTYTVTGTEDGLVMAKVTAWNDSGKASALSYGACIDFNPPFPC